MMKRPNLHLSAILVAIIFSVFSCSGKGQSGQSQAAKNNDPRNPVIGKPAPVLPTNGVTWINSQPLSLEELRGQVVLIDFWEYTCINCIRSFPFEKKIYKRYHQAGLEILGVHAPEFDIAYKTDNVREAVKRFKLPWPVAQDQYFSIWKAYESHTWPNYFLIGPQGNLLAHYSGEGNDAQIEQAIQKQLAESNDNFDASQYSVEEKNLFGASCGDISSETYIGKWHGRGSLQGQGGYQSGVRNFSANQAPEDGRFMLNGEWETAKNGATSKGSEHTGAPQSLKMSNGNDYPALTLKYHAREIYSVMNISHAKNEGQPIKTYVTQDGEYLTQENAAADTQFDDQRRSYIMVQAPRMYYLVLNPKGNDGEHVVTLWPTKPGLTVNSFTFSNNCLVDFAHLYSHSGGMEQMNDQ